MSKRDLFIRQLAFRTTNEGLRTAFQRFGELEEAKVAMENGRSRGFGFVTFKNEESAANAVREMNGVNLDGHNIVVAFSEKRGPNRTNDRRDDNAPRRDDNAPRRDEERGKFSSSRRRSRSPPRGRGGGFNNDRRPNYQHSETGTFAPPPPTAPYMPAPPNPFSKFNKPQDVPLETKIYVSGLPANTTEEMLVEHFSISGKIARKRPHKGRGFPDQWPYNIKLYRDDNGVFKGDALITYEDPNAASTAPSFFDGSDFFGSTISVQPARKV